MWCGVMIKVLSWQVVLAALVNHMGTSGFEEHIKHIQRQYCRRAEIIMQACDEHLTGLAEWAPVQGRHVCVAETQGIWGCNSDCSWSSGRQGCCGSRCAPTFGLQAQNLIGGNETRAMLHIDILCVSRVCTPSHPKILDPLWKWDTFQMTWGLSGLPISIFPHTGLHIERDLCDDCFWIYCITELRKGRLDRRAYAQTLISSLDGCRSEPWCESPRQGLQPPCKSQSGYYRAQLTNNVTALYLSALDCDSKDCYSKERYEFCRFSDSRVWARQHCTLPLCETVICDCAGGTFRSCCWTIRQGAAGRRQEETFATHEYAMCGDRY